MSEEKIMYKKLIIAIMLCFITEAWAQDTVWIESPRLVNERKASEKTLQACTEVATAFGSAFSRIQHSNPRKNISPNQITSLDTIIADDDVPIVLSEQAKKEYIEKLNKYFAVLKDQYESAQQQIKLCDYLET